MIATSSMLNSSTVSFLPGGAGDVSADNFMSSARASNYVEVGHDGTTDTVASMKYSVFDSIMPRCCSFVKYEGMITHTLASREIPTNSYYSL